MPPSEPRSLWPRLLVLVLLLGGFVVVVFHLLDLRVAAGKGFPAYSLYSEQDDGLAKAAHLLRKLGWTRCRLPSPSFPVCNAAC